MVATRNRIAKHFDPPAAPAVPPKEDYKGRYEFVSDAVLRAVAAVTRLLDSDDPAVVMKAAKMILDLEKTRMRHGKEVHGTPHPDGVERRRLLGPLPGDPDYPFGTVSPAVAAELDRPTDELEEVDAEDFDDGDDDYEAPAVRLIPSVRDLGQHDPEGVEVRKTSPPSPQVGPNVLHGRAPVG